MPTPLSQFKLDNDVQTLLFMGRSGTGKSIAACSWPGPVYNINMDDRMRAVIEYYKGKELLDQVLTDVCLDFDEVNDIVDGLEDNCPYKTIILDPLTKLSTLLMKYSFALRGTGEGQTKGKKKGKIDLTTIEDFNTEFQGIEKLLLNLKIVQKKFGTNIILIAHTLETTYMKAGGTESHRTIDIMTAGRKIVPVVYTMFDEIYNFTVDSSTGEDKFLIRTRNDGEVPARTCYREMPSLVDWTESSNVYNYLKQFYGLGEGCDK